MCYDINNTSRLHKEDKLYNREGALRLLAEILGQDVLRETMTLIHGPYIESLIEELIGNPQFIVIFPDVHIAQFWELDAGNDPVVCPCLRLTFDDYLHYVEDEATCPGCGLPYWMCECGDCRCEALYNDLSVPRGVKLIGESINRCIADIANGVVREKDVIKIRTSVTAKCLADWVGCLSGYLHMLFWRDSNPEKCIRIFWRLYHQGKIDQPLLRGESLPPSAPTWWRQPCPIHD